MTAPDNGDMWAYRCGELRHLVKTLLDVIDAPALGESNPVTVELTVDLARERLAEPPEIWQARAAGDLDRRRR